MRDTHVHTHTTVFVRKELIAWELSSSPILDTEKKRREKKTKKKRHFELYCIYVSQFLFHPKVTITLTEVLQF